MTSPFATAIDLIFSRLGRDAQLCDHGVDRPIRIIEYDPIERATLAGHSLITARKMIDIRTKEWARPQVGDTIHTMDGSYYKVIDEPTLDDMRLYWRLGCTLHFQLPE